MVKSNISSPVKNLTSLWLSPFPLLIRLTRIQFLDLNRFAKKTNIKIPIMMKHTVKTAITVVLLDGAGFSCTGATLSDSNMRLDWSSLGYSLGIVVGVSVITIKSWSSLGTVNISFRKYLEIVVLLTIAVVGVGVVVVGKLGLAGLVGIPLICVVLIGILRSVIPWISFAIVIILIRSVVDDVVVLGGIYTNGGNLGNFVVKFIATFIVGRGINLGGDVVVTIVIGKRVVGLNSGGFMRVVKLLINNGIDVSSSVDSVVESSKSVSVVSVSLPIIRMPYLENLYQIPPPPPPRIQKYLMYRSGIP